MKNSHLDRRSKYSIQAIRNALFDLLEEKELKNITVTDICKRADINRGTFYKYYLDVPDLYSKIELSIVKETCKIIEKDCLENFSIDKLLSNTLEIIVANKDFTCMLLKNPKESQYLHEIIDSFHPQFIETIRARIPILTESMCEVYFNYILGGVVNLLIQWIMNGMSVSTENMKNILICFIDSTLETKMETSFFSPER